ncbi:sialic acid-specific 9-O-acetylesterase [Pedobacter sp. BAL39]|uniref:sialate O-acetylesterase n=1 Tax=Pedobacter sp. BAL39 TaxID=391596 RepID=UPI00015596A4|nr:sialate O-acetylesterase [Pedobacter sp. BAL39]EDM38576.1 sialic acid-specific 9-O-acetylesterase [Pedobacter sp. BAL39]
MKRYPFHFGLMTIAGLFSIHVAQAKVVLPSVFSNNMVLQQKSDAAIWGKADAGKTVTVSTTWNSKTATAVADAQGNWKLKVATPAYGGPYQITISDGEALMLKNVLIGEVWVCSGQSNMEMPLSGWGKINNYEKEIADANYPNIRLLQAVKVTSNVPLEDAKVENGGWQECSPKYVEGFSSTAYFFAREVYEKTHIPIGLIHTSWGGTIAEAWTSAGSLNTLPDFVDGVRQIEAKAKNPAAGSYEEKYAAWEQLVASKDLGYQSAGTWKRMTLPALWEEAGLSDFDGVVYFQKKIILPASWTGADLKLSLGKIDDDDITYVNDVEVGKTVGYDQSRNYIIPGKLLKVGENVITVRVFDGAGGGGLYGEAKDLFLSRSGGEQMTLAGEWNYRVGLDLKTIASRPLAEDGPNRPTVLFNAMINPFVQFNIRGAIWYQGESNADRAYQYRDLFPTMIKDWRKQWNIGDFPFYFVQLANFMKADEQPQESAWAELREAQSKTLTLPNTGMAVIIDIGDAKDIHPKNKQEVGRRLGLIADHQVYGKKVSFSGPAYSGQKVVGKTIVLSFKHADQGLKSSDGAALSGFAIAGADHVYHWAKATIKGNTVIVESEAVQQPVSVRYGWGNNPAVNLVNGAGLPASPFRTDDYHGVTLGKK